MKKRKITFLGKRRYHPLIQALSVFIVTSIAVGIASIGGPTSDTEWYIASTMLLFFACGNPIMGIFHKNWKRYVLISIPAFLILGFILILLTNSIAVHGIKGLQAFQQYFFAVTVFYFLTLFLVGIFRIILKLINSIE